MTMHAIHTMERPVAPHSEVQVAYFDGQKRTIYTTDEETHFPDGCLITSRTDLDGIITHANNAFVILSGWEREELLGQPHSILRHPDIPAAAFADLWQTIKRGEKWRGYVKNLRKDGGFYWVCATVIPNIRKGEIVGYTSVRRKPSRQKVEEAEKLYATLRAAELANAQ